MTASSGGISRADNDPAATESETSSATDLLYFLAGAQPTVAMSGLPSWAAATLG